MQTENWTAAPEAGEQEGPDFGKLARTLLPRWRTISMVALLAGAAGYGASYLVTPTYLSRTLFMPPQQQQSSATAALSSLGALAGLAGGALRTSGDQYVAMMQSVTVSDRIIDKFDLKKVYEVEYMQDARKSLTKRSQISLGKKDGLITVEVEDSSQERAAAIANQYVDELRWLTSRLAVTEAQQRRLFFERRLEEAKNNLTAAQQALEDSGFSGGALKTEPRTAADSYAKLKAELTLAEVKVQTLRGSLADASPQVVQQLATVSALREQVARLEKASAPVGEASAGYVSKYRDFKYQETLFDLFAKQYELARVDESREGSLIQVVDAAKPAERKHAPRRSVFAAIAFFVGLFISASWIQMRRVPSA